jgi:hypothetical protein
MSQSNVFGHLIFDFPFGNPDSELPPFATATLTSHGVETTTLTTRSSRGLTSSLTAQGGNMGKTTILDSRIER